MLIKNTSDSYGIIAKALHWIISILIITLLCVGFYIASLPPSPEKWEILSMHKATGILVLMLVFLRVIWRLSNIQPALPSSLPNILVKLANANIFLLYFLMIAMPVSGATASLFSGHDISFYGLFTIKALADKSDISSYAWLAHETIAFIFIAAISAHILAALYHHFVLKDNVLRRMIR